MASLLFTSCSKEDDEVSPKNVNEKDNLQLIESIGNKGYIVDLLNSSGQLKVGHNKIYLRLKDSNGNAVNSTTIDWMPMMTMNMGGMPHEHSCPFSNLSKVSGQENLYEGYIVFTMASDAPNSFWNLEVKVTVDSQDVVFNDKLNVIDVNSDYNKKFTTVMGSDSVNYILALLEPTNPKIGVNDIVVALFKKGQNQDFPIVDNYTIKVDPRMPGMNNHSAPGSQDMRQESDGFYHGKVGLSMSGYWKINLILQDASDITVRGEPIKEGNLESSLNFKLEF